MSVPIEALQLEKLLEERVFVKWVDQSGTTFTLGSCLYENKQNPKFAMTAHSDAGGYIHIHFSLMVSIKLAGKKEQMEMILVVPPDADFSSASTPRPISSIDDLSHDASAIHEAGLSNSQYVFLLQFNLTTKGFVVTKKKTAPIIRPSTRTADKLIRSLESLSNTTIFSVYIRPSTYAEVGLEKLRTYSSNTCTATDTHKPNIKEMYIQQGAMLVEWSRFENQQHPLPPSYAQPSPEVQVPQSPPIIFERETSLINTIEAAIAETIPETPIRTPVSPNIIPVPHGISSPSIEEPTRTPISPNLTPVLHGIFSPSIEESLHGKVAEDLDVDSDEEHLAYLNARELSQQFNHDLEVSKILKSKFVQWIQTAIQINSNVYTHKRLITKLSILANCARTSNAGIFDATIPWCSALFFYDPFDYDDALGLWEERNLWFISDIAKLIKWANGVHYGAEMSPLLVNDFMKLGNTARSAALHPRHNKDGYNLQKGVCVGHVFMEFVKPGTGIRKEHSKPVSRKSLGTDGNTSKRVKI